MKKRFVPLLMAGVLIITLVACQAQKPDTGIHIEDQSSETHTMSFFAPLESNGDAFRDLTLQYNKANENVQISFDGVDTAEGYDRFLQERLDAGKAVDIFIVNAEAVKDIARKGQFYDLSNLDSFGRLSESAKEQAVVDGVAYTIPLKMAVYMMEVNVSLLERHGLKVPQNYDEFLHCCQVLKEQGIVPIALNRWWSMAVPVMARSLYPIYQADNRQQLIAKLNSGELKIGDYMIEGFRMFEEFLKEGYYGDNLVMEEVDSIKANTQDKENFTNGKNAFRFIPIHSVDEMDMQNGDESIYTGVPMLPDGVVSLPSIASRLCVNANSNYIEEAVAFVDFLSSQRMEIMEEESNSLSPLHSTAAAGGLAPWAQQIFDLMETGHQIPIEDMNVHFGYWDNTRALCLSMIGGMSAEEAAEEFNKIQMEEIPENLEAEQKG